MQKTDSKKRSQLNCIFAHCKEKKCIWEIFKFHASRYCEEREQLEQDQGKTSIKVAQFISIEALCVVYQLTEAGGWRMLVCLV